MTGAQKIFATPLPQNKQQEIISVKEEMDVLPQNIKSRGEDSRRTRTPLKSPELYEASLWKWGSLKKKKKKDCSRPS